MAVLRLGSLGYGLVRTMYKRAIRDDKERTDKANQGRAERREGGARDFVTPCVLRGDDGADRDILEKVTHNAKGKMSDHCTHLDFLPKCRAVAGASGRPLGDGRPVLAPQDLPTNCAQEGESQGDERK